MFQNWKQEASRKARRFAPFFYAPVTMSFKAELSLSLSLSLSLRSKHISAAGEEEEEEENGC
jgi:hypothetical protein